jgi:hypothetical protein
LRAVAVPKLFILREFEICVFVAVTVKFPVTVRLPATTLPKVTTHDVATSPPSKMAPFLTVRVLVDVPEYTLRSPATLL